MKVTSRNLPRLHLCYIQKKAYQIHQQKLSRATSSLSMPQKTPSKHIKSLSKNNKHMSSIPQLNLETYLKDAKSKKKFNYLTKKQNNRLSLAIEKCSPTIKHKEISKHSKKDQENMNRLSRFKTDPSSNKMVLKCQYSLEKMIIKQKRNESNTMSRLSRFNPLSRYSQRNTEENQPLKLDALMPRSTSNKKQPSLIQNQISRQDRFKGVIARNIQKVKRYFDNKNYQSLTEQRLQGFRQKAPSQQKHTLTPQVHRWKMRCFTTQMEEYP